MPVKPVVCNNTPLVAFWHLNGLTWLHDLYGEIIIPSAVHTEFLAVHTLTRQAALDKASWITVRSLSQPRQALLYAGLGRGEAEVLALAEELSAGLIIMDERRGRRYAERLGIPLTGTLGVLLLAKDEGLISVIAPFIQQLQQAGFYFSATLVTHVLRLANESATNLN